MARISDLSQELIDLIIDLLKSNHEALITCSLMSRTWTSRSQCYLLQKLFVHGDNKTVRRFLRTVSSTHRIVVFMKELKLISVELTSLHATIFAELLKALPTLRSLTLSEVQIQSSTGHAPQHWDIATLDYLELTYEDIPPQDLVHLLASFSRTKIQVLLLGCGSAGARVAADKYDLSAFTVKGRWKISDLCLMHNIPAGLILSLMSRMADPAALHSVTFGASVGRGREKQLKMFMTKFGPRLQTLQLHVTALWMQPQLYELILGRCTSLKSLSVLLLTRESAREHQVAQQNNLHGWTVAFSVDTDRFTLSTFTKYILPHIPCTVSHLAMSFCRDPVLESKFGRSNSRLLERFLAAEPQDLARLERNLLKLEALERVDVVVGAGRHAVAECLRERMIVAFMDLQRMGKLRFPEQGEHSMAWQVRPVELDCERAM